MAIIPTINTRSNSGPFPCGKKNRRSPGPLLQFREGDLGEILEAIVKGEHYRALGLQRAARELFPSERSPENRNLPENLRGDASWSRPITDGMVHQDVHVL